MLIKGYYTEPPLMVICCFSILESVIVLMANQETQELTTSKPKIDEETLLQLHGTLLECLSFIVRSLKEHEEDEVSEKYSETKPQHHYLVAAIRLLGAWLAEDSLSLFDELYSLLPYLLRLCDNDDKDVLKFLLPGFHSLVADCEPMLMKKGLLDVMLKHVQKVSNTL